MRPQKANLKRKARSLRKKGMGYGHISKKLRVSKSTAKLWTSDIVLTPEDKKRLYTKTIQNLSLGAQSQKTRREKEVKGIVEAAKSELSVPLTFETFRLAGAMLYWAEGNKGNDCRFTNSDPLCIAFMVEWFERILSVPPHSLSAYLNICAGQNEQSLKGFWSEVTRIPLENFRKSYIKPTNKGYKKNTLYYGTIQIRVPKGANFIHQINGWILGATSFMEPNLAKQKQKWYSLRAYTRS